MAHSTPGSKHQHVPDEELRTWRYGVGQWLATTRARRAALAGSSTGHDDEEGGIAATARMLLWKHRSELESDVGAALAHAFLGPRYVHTCLLSPSCMLALRLNLL
jgi:hypothetical protein